MTPDTTGLRDRLLAEAPEARLRPDRVRVVRAPGRVNLIGEHTDYNDGFVLPVAIDLEIAIAFVPTRDRRVEITLVEGGGRGVFELDSERPPDGTWVDYVAGVAWSLAADGVPVSGLRGVLSSTLPQSAGLSSSAALELAAAWALTDGAPPPDPVRLAVLAQRAENEYVGVRCGLMDQMASALGERDSALHIDCRSTEYRAVPLPLAEHAIVACESGSPRRLESSEYNARRAECETVVAALQAIGAPVRALRDADLDMLADLGDRIDGVARRRAEHVIRENQRVGATVTAMESGDLAQVGELFAESHASLRDLFEVSSPALDALVDIAGAVPGVVATRMTGAGFGGCTVTIVQRGAVADLRAAVAERYTPRTGLQATVHAIEPAAGAGLADVAA
jgi:galactokinase